MGKWKIHGCPRCGGSLFVDRDMEVWYEQCINCSYRNELKVSIEAAKKPDKPVKKLNLSLM